MRGELYDWEGRSAARLAGQNVRGFISLKLKKVDQFMMDRAILLACLTETWQVTPTAVRHRNWMGSNRAPRREGENMPTRTK